MRRATLAALFAIAVQPAGAAPQPAPQPPAAHDPAKPVGTSPTRHAPAHAAPAHAAAAAKPAPKPVLPASAPAAPLAPAAPAEPAKGTNTGLPLPRFASLKTDEVNLRTGPGTRYPIDWVYKRRDLPVQIEREFDLWRLITDSDGVRGWVSQATLTGRRNFVLTGGEHVLRSDGSDSAVAVARLKPGVVGRLRTCEATAPWCQVQVGEYRGWLKRDTLWGIFPGEAVQ